MGNRIKLSEDEYKLLKTVDFSDIENEIHFDDEELIFEYSSPITDIIFNEHIVCAGLDANYNPTNYGKKLYRLYDKIFLSE